jgi:hypothetical protein
MPIQAAIGIKKNVKIAIIPSMLMSKVRDGALQARSDCLALGVVGRGPRIRRGLRIDFELRANDVSWASLAGIPHSTIAKLWFSFCFGGHKISIKNLERMEPGGKRSSCTTSFPIPTVWSGK